MTALPKLLEELDALYDKATKGPLSASDRGIGYEIHDPTGYPINSGERDTFKKEDAEFIIALHNAYPALRAAARDKERYLDAIFAMADAGWLSHGAEGMDDVQKAVYEIAQEHPEYKRRDAAAAKERGDEG